MSWIRALFAAGVSLLFPGVGHALLRDWVRALLFAGLYVSAAALLLGEELAAAESVWEMAELVEAKPMTTQFLFSFLILFAAADAGFRGLGVTPGSGAGSDGPTCPNCGRELDETLEFCHWCTTRLERPAGADAESRSDGDVPAETGPKTK